MDLTGPWLAHLQPALGRVAASFLDQAFGIRVLSHVVRIGAVESTASALPGPEDLGAIDAHPVRCFDAGAGEAMLAEIAAAQAKAGVPAVSSERPSGNCMQILVQNVKVAEQGLEADHREQGHLTPIAIQLGGHEIDHAVSIALVALRSKKY